MLNATVTTASVYVTHSVLSNDTIIGEGLRSSAQRHRVYKLHALRRQALINKTQNKIFRLVDDANVK